MLKKMAQGLSITTIIVAIIGLIILVVIVAMLSGKLGAFGKGSEKIGNIAKTCEEQGGVPPPEGQKDCPDREIASKDSLALGKKCCKSA